MTIHQLQVYRFALPFRAPVRMGNTWCHTREGVLLRLSDGALEGWGEAAPLLGWSGETLDDVIADLLACRSKLPVSASALSAGLSTRTARFATDTACRALQQRVLRDHLLVLGTRILQPTLRLAVLWGDHSEGAGEPRNLPLAQAVKVKVGLAPWQKEAELLRAIRGRLGPLAELRLDANRRWSTSDAASFVRATADLGVDFIEEPTDDPYEWRTLLDMGVSCAIDESLHEAVGEDAQGGHAFAERVIDDHPHASVLVVKPSLLGAWEETLAFFEVAGRRGRRVVISSAYESGVGLQAVIALAANNPQPEAAGLDTHSRLQHDLLEPALPLIGGFIDVEKACDLRRLVDTSRLTAIS